MRPVEPDAATQLKADDDFLLTPAAEPATKGKTRRAARR